MNVNFKNGLINKVINCFFNSIQREKPKIVNIELVMKVIKKWKAEAHNKKRTYSLVYTYRFV